MNDKEIRQEKKHINPVEVFMIGANKGWNMAIKSMFPAVIFAYVLIIIMEQLGILTLVGKIFDPIMGIFGLPGVAITCIVTGIMTRPAGIATGLTLIQSGMMTSRDLTILVVPIMIIGACIPQFVRVVVVSGCNSKSHKWILITNFVVAFASIWLMDLILSIMGI